jgi:hypothetical protein
MSDDPVMIPAQRHGVIIDHLARNGAVTIAELQALFNISHMTVHRDLDTLAQQGIVQKVRGGAVRGPNIGGAATAERRCMLCGMRVPPRTEITLTRRDKSQVFGCCAHCALLLMNQGSEIDSALARDFLFGRMTNVLQATFLIGSEIRPCCMPSTLCFASASEALRFQKGFGGEVYSYDQAQKYLAQTHGRKV